MIVIDQNIIKKEISHEESGIAGLAVLYMGNDYNKNYNGKAGV